MSIAIFGGKSPIGTAISEGLARAGSRVIHISRSENLVDADDTNGLKITMVRINLEDENESLQIWRDLVDEHNIKSVVFSQRYRGDMDNFSKMYQCDVITPFKLVQELCRIKYYSEKRLIFFTSPAANQILQTQNFQYHATKSAISIMNKYFASGVMKNLTSNAICPSSYVFKARAADFYKDNADYFESVSRTIPSSRYTSVDDIVTTVEFLLLRAPVTINGLEISIDGGLSTLDQSALIDKFIPISKKL